jgi:hypothetical protein
MSHRGFDWSHYPGLQTLLLVIMGILESSAESSYTAQFLPSENFTDVLPEILTFGFSLIALVI